MELNMGKIAAEISRFPQFSWGMWVLYHAEFIKISWFFSEYLTHLPIMGEVYQVVSKVSTINPLGWHSRGCFFGGIIRKYAAGLSRASRSNERSERLPASGKATQLFGFAQGRLFQLTIWKRHNSFWKGFYPSLSPEWMSSSAGSAELAWIVWFI